VTTARGSRRRLLICRAVVHNAENKDAVVFQQLVQHEER